MRLVIQRVSSAKVFVSERTVSEIGKGLFILVGVGHEDRIEYANAVANKIVNMRLMSDKNDKMNLSVKDVNGQVLVVSQFTLLGDTNYGRRPSFIHAATPEVAGKIYEKLVDSFRSHGIKVETGEFGSYMNIEAELDGPVTITLDYPQNV
ncbi:MAG: D-tyrosyl-tRNA(Tyr) deacylase [Candidatus Blackburnbacteria bacterium]|nr:D-tyrosyl-tRNA(Tyr) deacylase [Candidatus Blackburnbacteria bacterium]